MDVCATTRHHAFRLGKVAGIAGWCALIVLVLAVLGTTASANPFFFSKTGQNCNFCHQQGREMSGVEGLSDAGRAFLQTFKRCPDCALRDFAAGNHGNQGATVTPSGPAPAPSRPTPQPASSGKFTFHVCNHSRHTASIAVSYRVSTNPDTFHAQGWANLNPGGCTNLGPYPQGGFWYYAFAKSGQQWSGETELCVDKKSGFSRTYGKGAACREDRVRFYFQNVHASDYYWNLGN
jgi:uncharacterized membrane protein